jgi:hypothetical protein
MKTILIAFSLMFAVISAKAEEPVASDVKTKMTIDEMTNSRIIVSFKGEAARKMIESLKKLPSTTTDGQTDKDFISTNYTNASAHCYEQQSVSAVARGLDTVTGESWNRYFCTFYLKTATGQ